MKTAKKRRTKRTPAFVTRLGVKLRSAESEKKRIARNKRRRKARRKTAADYEKRMQQLRRENAAAEERRDTVEHKYRDYHPDDRPSWYNTVVRPYDPRGNW